MLSLCYIGRLERIELSTQDPQTWVLPLNYNRHTDQQVYVYQCFSVLSRSDCPEKTFCFISKPQANSLSLL